jgi:predicted nucleotidyltransferase
MQDMLAQPQSFLRQPLSAVFANPASVRVLRALMRHGGELSAPMLAERSRLTRPSVLAALDHLSGLGLVESIGSVRQRLHRIDKGHPLAAGLSVLFAAEADRFDTIIEAIRRAAIEAGVAAAWLYGSVARGEDRPDSDLDIAMVASIDLDAEKSAFRDALRALEAEWRFSASVVALGPEDVRRLAQEGDPWWLALLAEAVPLAGPDPVTLAASLSVRQRGAA